MPTSTRVKIGSWRGTRRGINQ
ncbi:hypothetical protein ECFRIK523_1807, partial [Escherichia coli FRIK523]